MEPKDYIDYFKTLSFSMTAFKDLEEQITREMARLNNIKPIHFNNPEKLNGRYEHNGHSLIITFIGRDLSNSEDNWTWVVEDVNYKNADLKLSILKYPKLNGYATMIKTSYGQKTEQQIKKTDLENIEWMKKELLNLVDLPF
jgi:hypothetical protein